MTAIRALIVDDEPLARETLRLLAGNDDEVEIVGECSGVDAAGQIAATKPDLLFLDVEMPEVDGFDVLRAAGADAVKAVIFVTAYDRYAVRAFEVHALDYLLKPFDDARFGAALQRAKEHLRGGDARLAGERIVAMLAERERAAQPFVRRFMVRVREKVVFVNAHDVDWIEAADYYVSLHVGGQSHLIRETMSELETRLDPQRFFRIHRSAIVNLDRVREMHPLFRGDSMVVLHDGTQLKLSRNRRDEFERALTR